MNAYMLTVSPADAVHAAALGQGHHRRELSGATGFYPTFNPHPGAQEMAGAVTTDTIAVQEQQVSAQMDAVNAAMLSCSAIAPADAQAWSGIYSAWQAWDQKLKGCLQYGGTSVSPPDLGCMLDFGWSWGATAQKLTDYARQAANYQTLAAARCPGVIQPPPVPVPPPGVQTCSWIDRALGRCQQEDTWASTIKLVAVFGILGLAVYTFGPLLAALAGAAATHVGGRPKELES